MRLPEEKVAVLQDYFEQQSDSLRSEIKVVHHDLVGNPDSCYAQVVRDVEELFKTSTEKK